MLALQGSNLKIQTQHESIDWTDVISRKLDLPLLKYHSKSLLDKCYKGTYLFADLPLYTLCDGAGGDPLGLISEARYLEISSNPNLSDIANYLYIAHPFLSHYCKIGVELLSILSDSGFSHSKNTADFNLFHFLCGARNTFTQIHNHATATALLLEGMKEWWLAPPTVTNAKSLQPLFLQRISFLYQNPAGSLNEWLAKNHEEISEIENLSIVIQPAGTSLYIPDKWYHGVLNHSYSRSITLSWDYALSHHS